MGIHVHVESRSGSQAEFSGIFFFLRQGLSLACSSPSEVIWPENPSDLSVSTILAPALQAPETTPGFLMKYWRSNSGSHAFKARLCQQNHLLSPRKYLLNKSSLSSTFYGI